MDIKEKSLEFHKKLKGKIEVISRAPVNTREDLSVAYTPGVAEPCLRIAEDPDLSYTYTRRHNMCLVVSDGSAVLGLGNIGPEAAMPVMEGKCLLFKTFGDVDAFPLVLASQDTDDIVNTIYLVSKSFGGVNLEDIAAPRCFEIEKRLKSLCDIPIFHDDQHGTAVVVLAALKNALKIVKKPIEDIKLVISGSGAAGVAIIKLLMAEGLKNIIMTDSGGTVYEGRKKNNEVTEAMAKITNRGQLIGSLADALEGADVYLGVSAPNLVTATMVRTMARDPIVFAMANPTPEIMPDEAKKGGAAVIGTGRSDFPNQINNVLAFPGIFRGAFDVRASDINDEMKIAAANALASLVSDSELNPENILPEAFDKRIKDAVAKAVSDAARKSGVARI